MFSRDAAKQGKSHVDISPDEGAEPPTKTPSSSAGSSYGQVGAEVAQILTSAKEAADSLVARARQEASALRDSTVRDCDDLLRQARERYERSAAHELELRRRIDAVEEAVIAMRSHLGSPDEIDDESSAGGAPTASEVLPERERDGGWTHGEAVRPSPLPDVPPGKVWTEPESGTVRRIPRPDVSS